LIRVKCASCGFSSEEYRGFYCPVCGGMLHPEHGFDYKLDAENRGIWRFSGTLPNPAIKISLGEGFTPLISSNRLFREAVFFKDEGRNPTGSFRDRAAAIIVSDVAERGVEKLIVASDGNMGASIAAYATRAGLKTTIYVPSWTDPEKVMLMRAFGARVIIYDKSLDDLLEIVERRASSEKLYDASSTHNVLAVEGLKTIALEILLDLGKIPKEVVLPLGSGLTLLSVFHGFEELARVGYATGIPKLIGVETCGNPVYSTLLGKPVARCSEEPVPGLAYRKPAIRELVVEILSKYGEVVVVTRREVYEAARSLARSEGLFVEPSSAVALAGALKQGLSDYSVVVLTGHGLKGPGAYAEKKRTRSTHLFPGSTKHLILEVLRENPGLTAYEIWKKLGLKITPQAIYQHLHDLARKGYVRLRVEAGVKKYYPEEGV